MDNSRMNLFLVDDDRVYLTLMEMEFKDLNQFNVFTFPTGEACVQHLNLLPKIIILDYHLDGIQKDAMNGIQTLDMIKQHNPAIPVIMLSAQDKIEVAVDCMHHFAYDYVVKSETAFTRIQRIISTLMYCQKLELELIWYMSRM
jgi:two-component system OmpR family response regulator